MNEYLVSELGLRVSDQRCELDDLTLRERVAGIEIVRKLENFYRVTDTEIQKSNFLTRFLNWIREFSFVPYTTRFYLEDGADDKFRAYSQDRFLKQFGGNFDEMYGHPSSDGWFGPSLRILAKEDEIRAQFLRA